MAAMPRMARLDLLRKAAADPEVDFLREALRVLRQELMEAEVAAQLGADRYERTSERTSERTGQRNGYRPRAWGTRVGSLPLRMPRVRDGSYFPGLLEPRTRAERVKSGGAPGGVCPGGEQAAGGRLGAGVGDERHRQAPGEPALSGA